MIEDAQNPGQALELYGYNTEQSGRVDWIRGTKSGVLCKMKGRVIDLPTGCDTSSCVSYIRYPMTLA